MSDQRKGGIAWTEQTWNPLRGCTRVSAGCENCYAETMAHRFSGPGRPYEGLTTIGRKGPRWNGTIRLVPEHLGDPLRWRRPRMVFVNSMSDLFHPKVPDAYIAAVFGVMAASPQHTFQILTKRPKRMLRWFQRCAGDLVSLAGAAGNALPDDTRLSDKLYDHFDGEMVESSVPWPLPNVWIGTSVENQETADERIPLLLQCPAAVRWVSAEPLLSAIDLSRWLGYNPLHDTSQRDGGNTFQSRRSRLGRGSPGRFGVADRSAPQESMGRHGDDLPSEDSAQDRRGDRWRVPDREGDGGRRPDQHAGAPARVEGARGTDPAGVDDQPQEREEIRQPPGEPRTGDVRRSGPPRAEGAQSGPSRPKRDEERDGQAERQNCSGDSSAAQSRGIAQVDRSGLRDLGPDGVEDRPSRAMGFSWLVVGGESGPGARACDVAWVWDIVNGCRDAGVPVFVKQLGADVRWDGMSVPGTHWPSGVRSTDIWEEVGFRMSLKHRKGGDPDEWPEDLRVREMPDSA